MTLAVSGLDERGNRARSARATTTNNPKIMMCTTHKFLGSVVLVPPPRHREKTRKKTQDKTPVPFE